MWDIRAHDCLHKFHDDGCVVGSALDVSSHHLAAGSSSGVVNLYSLSTLTQSSQPKPDKAIMNLTTKIENLRYSNTKNYLNRLKGLFAILVDGEIEIIYRFFKFKEFGSKYN